MANISLAAPIACPPPFLVGSNYPYVAGELDARLCSSSPVDPAIQCCLPCPLTDTIYPDDFNSVSKGAQWLAMPALACTVILLLSFLLLPVQRTNRHYLTICLIVAMFVLELAYVVPLATEPNQCADPITPNNMRTDISCGVSGFLLLFGGFAGAVWVFIRSLSVHLQICWKVVPAEIFFYAAQVGGWGLSFLFPILAMTISGVSYRLGSTCYINHANSIGIYWGPLLAFAGLSLVMQLVTFIYCIKVYLAVAGEKGLPSSNVSGAPDLATTSSGRNVVMKRATYRRVRKVIALQWRGMTVVVLLVITTCYLAIVFLLLDQSISQSFNEVELVLPWVLCIVASHGVKETCQDLAYSFVLREQVVLPVPYLIVLGGVWCLLFLGRWGMVLGWRDLLLNPSQSDRRSSSSLRSNSQQSFRDRMQATPQQLHLIKGEDGLAIARKNEPADIEMMSPGSPARVNDSPYDDDYFYAIKEDSLPQSSPPTRAQARAISPAPLASIGGQPSFNFSRPSTAQQLRNSDIASYAQPAHSSSTTTSPVAVPRSTMQSPFQSSSYSYHLNRPQRSASNTSENWLMRDPGPISNAVPDTTLPRSTSSAINRSRNASRSASRSASRADAHQTVTRPSQGLGWDPASTFASPMSHEARRSVSGSPVPERSYVARGYTERSQGSGYL